MPNILMNPEGRGFGTGKIFDMSQDIMDMAYHKPYEYEYPEGLDLRPDNEGIYKTIKDTILFRARGSNEALRPRFPGWRDIDKTLTTYIVKDDVEKGIKKGDDRKPVRVVVPTTYAVLETLLTYNTAAFLDEPYFKYDGWGPEDVLGAKLLELVVAQQCRRMKVGLDLHTMWRDSFAYGFGSVHITYEKKTGWRTVEEENSVFSALRNTLVGKKKNKRERVEIFSGGKLEGIDPYLFLPDPDTPIERVQEGEFVGWIERTNLMTLLELERDNPGVYFNCRYLKHIGKRGRTFLVPSEDSARYDRWGKSEGAAYGINVPIDVINMYMKIIPREWGLGEEEYPEKWLFSLAADQVLIRAQPMNLDHGDYPVAVSAPNYDGHGVCPIATLETVYGLQQTLDWLFDSHIANTRKAINDMLIVDPQSINIHDIANPKPGKLIRTRRQAWGRGIKDMIMQLPVNDVTKQHIQDTQYVQEIIRNTTGATDAVMGIRRKTSERVSAQEAMDTKMGGLSRLEKAAKISSLQAHQDIAYQMAWNTRQFMKEDVYVKMIGDWERVLAEDFKAKQDKGRLSVSPKDIDIDFDVIPHDGMTASSGSPGMWMQLFQIIATNPYLTKSIDIVRIFKHAARMMGAKNIDSFVIDGGNIQPEVVPNEQVLEGVDNGTLTPMEGEA